MNFENVKSVVIVTISEEEARFFCDYITAIHGVVDKDIDDNGDLIVWYYEKHISKEKLLIRVSELMTEFALRKQQY